jgi:hypothetical protein
MSSVNEQKDRYRWARLMKGIGTKREREVKGYETMLYKSVNRVR